MNKPLENLTDLSIDGIINHTLLKANAGSNFKQHVIGKPAGRGPED